MLELLIIILVIFWLLPRLNVGSEGGNPSQLIYLIIVVIVLLALFGGVTGGRGFSGRYYW